MLNSYTSNKIIERWIPKSIAIWRPNLFKNEHYIQYWIVFFLGLLLESFAVGSTSGRYFPIKFHLRNTLLRSSIFLFCICTVVRTRASYFHSIWAHTCTHTGTLTSIRTPVLEVGSYATTAFFKLFCDKNVKIYSVIILLFAFWGQGGRHCPFWRP